MSAMDARFDLHAYQGVAACERCGVCCCGAAPFRAAARCAACVSISRVQNHTPFCRPPLCTHHSRQHAARIQLATTACMQKQQLHSTTPPPPHLPTPRSRGQQQQPLNRRRRRAAPNRGQRLRHRVPLGADGRAAADGRPPAGQRARGSRVLPPARQAQPGRGRHSIPELPRPPRGTEPGAAHAGGGAGGARDAAGGGAGGSRRRDQQQQQQQQQQRQRAAASSRAEAGATKQRRRLSATQLVASGRRQQHQK